MNQISTIVKTLKENEQDFEFYPTTDEILNCIKLSVGAVLDVGFTNCKSVLDIGAGTCKFKTFMSEFYKFNYYAIEKSEILINNYSDDVIVLGADFHTNILYDKKVDVIFSNPPYSEYVEWTTRILKEGNATHIYMVIPSRWKENKQLNQVMDTLKIQHKILGTFDFLNAERSARAIVDVIEFTKSTDEHYERDPFSIWFNETFKASEEDDFLKKYDRETIKNEIVSLSTKDKVSLLCEYYNEEIRNVQDAFIKVCALSPKTLKAIGIDKKAVKIALKEQLNSIKIKYWNEFYNCLDVITDRLTHKTRYEMKERFNKHGAVDFTEQNVRAVLLWIVKNTYKYMESQLVDLFKHFSDFENIKKYKSNKRTFTADEWRWNKGDAVKQKYSLDYRIIACEHWNNNYSWKEEIDDRKAKTATDDICTIAFNLGFRCVEKQEVKEFGEKYYYYLSDGKPLFEVKVYKNGNCHYKFNTEFSKAFNIEAGRILGWIRNKEECKEEFNTDRYFNVMNNNQLLLGFTE